MRRYITAAICALALAGCSAKTNTPPQTLVGSTPSGPSSLAPPSAEVGETKAAAPISASVPSNSPAAATTAEPTSFVLTGTFRYLGAKASSGCFGREGYDSIEPGAIVRVLDPKGDVVAGGELDQGAFEPKADDPDYGICTFKLRVPDVPLGPEFYEVAIAEIGPIKVTAAEAQSGKLNVAT